MSKYIDKRLLNASKGGGNFIKLDVSESFKGKYLEYEYRESDNPDYKASYYFKFKMEDGSTKEFRSKAKSLLEQMAKVVPGSIVEITLDTIKSKGQRLFTVEILKAAKAPQEEADIDVDEDEEEEEEAPKKKKKKKIVEEEEEDDEDEEENEPPF